MPKSAINYPEWRPDLSTNVEVGTGSQAPFLSICQGVRPRETFYEQHPTLNTAPTNAVSDTVVGAFTFTFPTSSTLNDPLVYAGTEDSIEYSSDAGATAWSAATVSLGSEDVLSWRFAQTGVGTAPILAAPYAPGELGDSVYPKLLLSNSSGTTFTPVGGTDPPSCAVIAVVGQFAVAGQGFTPSGTPSTISDSFLYGVRWSAIGDMNDWPEPLTADALAKQSGMQNFSDEYGYVTYIAPLNALSALVFQQRAIHRMNYIGGDKVWQFDTLATGIGSESLHSSVQIGGWVYFVNRSGFYRTNGQSIEPIGEGRVDRFFSALVDWDQPLLVTAAVDEVRNTVAWAFPDSSDTGTSSNILLYNFISQRWAHVDQAGGSKFEYMFSYVGSFDATKPAIYHGFDTSHKQRAFTATSTFSSILRTGEENIIPGQLATVQGVRPICDDLTADPTIAIRTRMLLKDTPSSTTATPNTRTGIHNARVTGRYHAVEMTVASNKASRISGLEIMYEPAGEL